MDVSGVSTRENNLNDKPLPGLISIETSYNISGDTVNSGYSSVCSQIISENIKIEYAECSNLDFTDTDCAACIATGLDSNFTSCTIIDSANCSNQIAPNSFSIGLENYDLEDTEYIWLDNECFLAVPGVTLSLIHISEPTRPY